MHFEIIAKNKKSAIFLIFPFVCVCVWWGGGAGGGASAKPVKARQGEVLAGEWEQLLSYVAHCVNLIHIALNFYQDIP